MDHVASFLNIVEEVHSLTDKSEIAAILESLIVSKPRDKKLKNTKSWSTNCLIRLYHCHESLKTASNQPQFVTGIKQAE